MKFEYKTLILSLYSRFGADDLIQLNREGAQGWEICSAPENSTVLLKRKIVERPKRKSK